MIFTNLNLFLNYYLCRSGIKWKFVSDTGQFEIVIFNIEIRDWRTNRAVRGPSGMSGTESWTIPNCRKLRPTSPLSLHDIGNWSWDFNRRWKIRDLNIGKLKVGKFWKKLQNVKVAKLIDFNEIFSSVNVSNYALQLRQCQSRIGTPKFQSNFSNFVQNFRT